MPKFNRSSKKVRSLSLSVVESRKTSSEKCSDDAESVSTETSESDLLVSKVKKVRMFKKPLKNQCKAYNKCGHQCCGYDMGNHKEHCPECLECL